MTDFSFSSTKKIAMSKLLGDRKKIVVEALHIPKSSIDRHDHTRFSAELSKRELDRMVL